MNFWAKKAQGGRVSWKLRLESGWMGQASPQAPPRRYSTLGVMHLHFPTLELCCARDGRKGQVVGAVDLEKGKQESDMCPGSL